MPVIAVTIVDQTVGVTQVGEIGPIGPTGTVSAAGDGTAAAPGIAFATDTNTGLFRPGADILAASTGGTERVRVNASGNVGIGTVSPASRLHISGEGPVLTIADTIDGIVADQSIGRIDFISNDSSLGLAGQARARIDTVCEDAFGTRFGLLFSTHSDTALLPRLKIDRLGNVGIGTTSPGTPLDVVKDGTNTGLGYSNISKLVDSSGNKGLTIGYDNSAQTTVLTANTTAVSSNMAFWTYEAGGSGWAERMRVTSAGNVGIGTSSPATKLHLAQASDAATQGLQLTRSNGTDFMRLYMTAGVGNLSDTLVFNSSFGGDVAAIGRTGGAYFAGNVGIGTSSPTAILHTYVTGTGNKTGLILGRNTSNVSDTLSLVFNVADLGDQASIAATPTGAAAGDLLFSVRSSSAMTERMRVASSGHVTPGADNTQNFGSGSLRWATIYAGTGTINTSDERYKVLREGGDLSDAEFAAWSNVRAIVYRDLDSFERKGDAARLHVGYSWQSIQAAFEAEGLDAGRYGLWCEDALEAPVEKTRMVSRPVEGQTETITVLDDDGKPVFEQVQETEEVEQPFEEVRMIDGAPVLVKGVRTVAQPVFDSVQIRDEDGELLFDTPQPIEDPETGELVEGDPIPRMAPVPRMIRKAKTETVPVMEEVEETYTEMEPTGETRGALRYNQCSVIEAAWLRRELASVVARLSALEAA